jgi:hypothetical protein
MGNGMIVVNIDKAKQIAHEMRRDKRAQEFAPLDVKATIPSEAVEAESARQVIREKYAVIQQNIDAAESPEQIKEAINAA